METNKGEVYYNSLFEKVKDRLSALRAQPALKDIDMMDVIESEGVNERFLEVVSATTAILIVPPMFAPLVARSNRTYEQSSCYLDWITRLCWKLWSTFRSSAPTVDDLLFDVLSFRIITQKHYKLVLLVMMLINN